jgi:hypothetical protein
MARRIKDKNGRALKGRGRMGGAQKPNIARPYGRSHELVGTNSLSF